MNKSQVNKALTADDKPTPGYLYKEIADMTHASLEDCEKLVTLLIARLGKNDCNVKYKTLMVIKHVARLGRAEFKRIMQRHVDTLKLNLQFRGPKHPLKGDAPNKAVRDLAEDTIKAVFENDPTASAASAALAGRMTGIGSSGSTTTAAAAGGSSPVRAPPPLAGSRGMRPAPTTGSGMAAVGNYNPTSPKPSTGLLGTMKGMFTRATGGKGSAPPVGRSPGAGGFNYATNRGPTARAGGSAYRGPASGSPAPAGRWGSGGGGGSSPTRPTGSAGGWGVTGATSGSVGAGASDGEYERGLVMDVTAPGGVRPVPDPAKLRAFVTAASTLDPARLASLLDERLTTDSWQVQTKALLVVQTLAGEARCTPHKVYLADHCDEILALHDDASRDSVRKQAAATLTALGVDYTGAGGAVGDAGDLLDMGAPAPAPAAGGGDDIFGGMSFGAPAPAPTPAPAPAAGGDDMFGGMTFGGAAPAPAPAPAPAAGGFTFTAAAPAPAEAAPAPAASGFTFTAPAPAPTPAPAPAPIDLSALYGNPQAAAEVTQAAPTFDLGMGGGALAAPAPVAAPVPAPAAGVGGFSFSGPASSPAPSPAPGGMGATLSTPGAGTLAGGAQTSAPAPAPAPADPFAGLMGM